MELFIEAFKLVKFIIGSRLQTIYKFNQLFKEAIKLVKFLISFRLQTIYKFNQQTTLQKILKKILQRNIVFKELALKPILS